MPTTLNRDETLLLAAVDRARRAPSVHNTQPWSFHLHDGGLELHSDPARALTAVDPAGRELVLSCGAALLHLRLALAAAGAHLTVDRFPDPTRPHVVARVQVAGLGPVDAAAAELDRLANERQTNRRRFQGVVSQGEVAVLCAAAEREGVGLQPIVTQEDRAVVMVLQQAADAAQTSSASYRNELRSWVGSLRISDGIPWAGTTHVSEPVHDLAPRNFALGGSGGLAQGEDSPGTALLLLYTERDEPMDWVRAGEGLARVWLEATRLQLAVQPLSQSVEHPGTRERLRHDLRLRASWPQLLLRVGYAGPQPSTPRRAVPDVLVFEEVDHG